MFKTVIQQWLYLAVISQQKRKAWEVVEIINIIPRSSLYIFSPSRLLAVWSEVQQNSLLLCVSHFSGNSPQFWPQVCKVMLLYGKGYLPHTSAKRESTSSSVLTLGDLIFPTWSAPMNKAFNPNPVSSTQTKVFLYASRPILELEGMQPIPFPLEDDLFRKVGKRVHLQSLLLKLCHLQQWYWEAES